MEVDEEQIPSSDSIEQHIDSLKKSYDKAPLPSNDGIDWSKEGYERSKLDKSFIMFQAKVSFNPTQCLRYKFNNPEPLLYSSKNKTKINKARKCPICNCPRVHEMQLMPSLLSILPVEEYAENESKEKKKSVLETFGMEFGTIHIFTCINDCSPGAYHEEEILVETESDI
ncbi:Programmed cell death protein 2 domain-containing protein [Rozella allomycis CSF55]|uniref:Programmed cell death protein 2 domain-containing protein n=1 Tax=Rozella allomycis (strain CSF55) TaxID=988480 RepID=A0A075AZX2_ROZAC|nr:Programmed cell death protein 2 domain-containing protein [Rozella allomycis CSF55]|eukprot:EPZ35659.1 Programmed cell death protein 2 domain-containing protein [Rozella allomycis CSF55]